MYQRFWRSGLFGFCFLFTMMANGQTSWPKTVELSAAASVTVYQPQPEKLDGNLLTGRSAFSVKRKSGDEPVFGVLWFTTEIETNRDNRMVLFNTMTITHIRLSGAADTAESSLIKSRLESEFVKWKIKITLDDLVATMEQEQKQAGIPLNNNPPKIIFTTLPSVLINIDSMPVLKTDEKLGMKKVVNTAFLIVQNPGDNQFYLYGGKYWYSSPKILEGWKYIKTLPAQIQSLDQQIKKSESENTKTASGDPENNSNPPSSVLISTVPAELIQSAGEPRFTTIAGTGLLYISNSEDDIFKSLTDNQYYILLSGRWYTAVSLQGPWTFKDAGGLPADFSRIPEGSAKDDVLASVPGTEAANNAVMDAQVPQTAKVDKATASCSVKYDGTPVFAQIEGTHLFRATNTVSKVIRDGSKYYCVDAGVWYQSSAPTGPWKVSEDRPAEVNNIPPSNETYNVKYVQIYQVTPTYVYVGYTPGYMGCYINGAVVVYGTGYMYYPWYAGYYYPRPVTYGFSVRYNPWTGWSFGFHYSTGYFSFHFYTGGHYGYWGPRVYHPVHYPVYRGGMYGGNSVHINGGVHIHQGNNIYINQRGVRTSDIKRNPQPTPYNKKISNNNILSDQQGNVFRSEGKSQWQQRSQNNWSPAENSQRTQLNRDLNNRQRGQTMDNSYMDRPSKRGKK